MVAQDHRRFSHSRIALFSIALTLGLFCIAAPKIAAHAADVSLSWNENTESYLAGYRVFHRLDGQSYDYNDPAWQGITPSCTISDLTENTPHFFVVRAYSTSGTESANSDEVIYQGLMISNASDRSSAEPLGGQSVSGNLYVFTHPDDDVDFVAFYLDDASMTGPAHTVEDIERYDFDGTAGDGSANPFDTASLGNGSHTITAQIQFTDGTEQTLTGAFSVNNTVLPTLESLSIEGSQSVNESTSQPYIATATYSDGSSQSVTANASWSENSAYASISSDGILTASSVTSNQVVTITATYSEDGATKTAQKTVAIANLAPSLSSLSISGSSSVNEGTMESYTATATYNDGTTQSVTANASWSENSAYASISNHGVFTASLVTGNQAVTITASYAKDGVTKTAEKIVTIANVTPVLSSLSISGSNSLNENASTNYTATALYSDNSSETVSSSAIWGENTSYASISNGVLSSSEITEDEILTITASFTDHGVTKTAQKTVTIIDVPLANMPPEQPVVTSPYDGQTEDCEIAMLIELQDFSDVDGDAHAKSAWQISTESDFASSVLDVISTDHLTSLTVPHTLLEGNTTYYLRVKFFDVYLAPSEWSDTVTFVTAPDTTDVNDDGVPDVQEVPMGVDLDGNGIDDVNEPENIKSVQSEDGKNQIGVYKDSDSVQSIDAVEMIDPSTLPVAENTPASLPENLFSYRISVDEPGAIAYITIYFNAPIAEGKTFYKYDTINGWSDYSDHTTFNGDGRSITLEVKDGGFGDCDGVANGIILDPGGLGDSLDTSLSSGNSRYPCFIATIGCGSMNLLGSMKLYFFVLSLLGIALLSLRRIIKARHQRI